MIQRKHVSVSVLVFLQMFAVVSGTISIEEGFSEISRDWDWEELECFPPDAFIYADLMQPPPCRSFKSNGNQSRIDPFAQIL